MRHLLNTLYVLSEDVYLSLDGENLVVSRDIEVGRVPLHTLETILCFSYRGASPALLGACATRGISFSFFDNRGRYLAGVHGQQRGNVLLRKEQYRRSFHEGECLEIARGFIAGKVFNSRWVLERVMRDHRLRINAALVEHAAGQLQRLQGCVLSCDSISSLRGIEGEAASVYFGAFDEMILRDKEFFRFEGRVRRPPTDAINAMLSLFYVVLARDCAAALEGVGIDPYVGVMHADRPGRQSMALDLMEELRPVVVDRFVVAAINNQVVKSAHFVRRETGEVRLTEDGRRSLFKYWQDKKKTVITHPYLKEKVPWGLVPHVQALLLARCIRGDLDGYPPFFWK